MILWQKQPPAGGESLERKKSVLLTGAAGQLGTCLRQQLAGQYHFRCLDRQAIRGVTDGVVADCGNFKAVLRAMQGMDAVIHLAEPAPDNLAWELCQRQLSGSYHVFEAAHQAGVQRLIYLSSYQVMAGYTQEKKLLPVTIDMSVRPHHLSAVGVACSEVVGRYFAETHGLSVVCLRLGIVLPQDPPRITATDRDLLSSWCSHRDLAQLVQKSLEVEQLPFAIFYAVSGNSRRQWDISNAQRLLGYQPQDNAEWFLSG